MATEFQTFRTLTTSDILTDSDLLAMARQKPIHFMGIGGAGMLPLAELVLRNGGMISGCDSTDGTGARALREMGVAVEIGVIMLVYLNQAWRVMLEEYRITRVKPGEERLKRSVIEGALLRVRPVMMTATAIVAGLLPILYGGGTGSEVMSRIAAPMIGGMLTAPLLSMLVIPAGYLLLRRRQAARRVKASTQGDQI